MPVREYFLFGKRKVSLEESNPFARTDTSAVAGIASVLARPVLLRMIRLVRLFRWRIFWLFGRSGR